MSKINQSVEIVISTNKRLSSMSLTSRVEIKRVLEKKYSDVRITDVREDSDVDGIITRQPDLVFLGMKFAPDDLLANAGQTWLSQRLHDAGIAYTGSSEAAAILEHNKDLAKQRIRANDLATAASILIEQGQAYTNQDITINYPIFIKPVDGGGGSGINESSLVYNFEELTQQVTWLLSKVKSGALLETYLPGREFSVGILQDTSSDDFYAMPLEIVAPLNQSGSRYLSSRIKQEDSEQTSEVSDQELKARLSAFALAAFTALGAQDYGRIDVRMDAAGQPHFLEANLLPSLLNNYGNLPKASMMNIGLSHEDLILQIATLGARKGRDMQLQTEDEPIYTINSLLQALPA